MYQWREGCLASGEEVFAQNVGLFSYSPPMYLLRKSDCEEAWSFPEAGDAKACSMFLQGRF